ncbi:FAD-binding monooxygenase [Nostoc sp. 3335mG]|nr:FAD-binding monooxygenase [Nostoc sp. 3335mG]
MVVIGGGIAGVALNRALRRSGIETLVLERRLAARDGLAINLPGNAIAALQALGLGDRLRNLGKPIARREYRTETGRLLFAVDEDAFWGSDLRPRCVLRSDLMDLLSTDQAAGALLSGAEATGFAASADRVCVQLSTGNKIEGEFLIGADGVHSAVRRALFGAAQVSTARLATASWRFMVPNSGINCWTLWASADAAVLLIPVSESQMYGWAAVTRQRKHEVSTSSLSLAFRDFAAQARRAIEAAQSEHGLLWHSPLEEVRLDRWGAGRVLLIGDAAHATAPVWAQGAALALEDALVLADLLKNISDRRALVDAFRIRRSARVKHVQTMTDRMSKAAHLPAVVRNLLLPILGPRSYRATYQPLKSGVL